MVSSSLNANFCYIIEYVAEKFSNYELIDITQPISHTEWPLIIPYDHLDLTLLIYKCLVHTGKIIIAEKDHMNSQGQFSHISVLLLHIDNI